MLRSVRQDVLKSSMKKPRSPILLAILSLLCLATTSIQNAPAYYGGGGYYRGGYGGYYHGGCWGGNGGWYGTGIPNGLGWTMFGLGAAGVAATVAAPYLAPPVYAVPAAPVLYQAPGYYQPAPQTVAAQEVPQPSAPPNETLSKAQSKLSGLGYFKGTIDGYYGPQTARAVEQFQADNNLPVNGRLDLKTLSCLGISL